MFAYRDWSKVVNHPDYVLVACLFLCSVIRICIRERFWSGVVDNLARMAVRCKDFLRYLRAWSTCIYKHSSNTYCYMFASTLKMDSSQRFYMDSSYKCSAIGVYTYHQTVIERVM